MQARQRIKRAQKKRIERVNLGRKEVTLKIGDPVYHKKHQRHGKLDKKWSPYYMVIDQTGPVTFVVWDQINGRVKRAHANDLKLAELEEWEVPEEKEKKTTNQTKKVGRSPLGY